MQATNQLLKLWFSVSIKHGKLFSLCVDDFGVESYNKEGLYHLKNIIEKEYTAKVDWKDINFLGYTLDCHYDKGYVDLSMLKYIKYVLAKLKYIIHQYLQYSPHKYHHVNWAQKE